MKPRTIDSIREGVPLASVLPGKATEGSCPWCRTQSFDIHPEGHLYHCGNCGEAGDVITATMKLDGVTFREAVIRLQDRASHSLR